MNDREMWSRYPGLTLFCLAVGIILGLALAKALF